jgi:hypothetical protein
MPVLSAMLLPVARRGGGLYAYRAELTRDASGDFYMDAEPAAEGGIASGEITRLVIPASGAKPQRDVFARFLAKVAVECMALRMLENAPELLPEFRHGDPGHRVRDEHGRSGCGRFRSVAPRKPRPIPSL